MDKTDPTIGEKRPAALSELAWLGAGLVLSCVSATFYRQQCSSPTAVPGPDSSRNLTGVLYLRRAVLFFVLLGLAIALLIATGTVQAFSMLGNEIQKAYDNNQIPDITIQGGQASVDAPQPFILFDYQGVIAVFDTTGRINEMDPSQYNEGFLLTRTQLHIFSSPDLYQRFELSDLQRVLAIFSPANADPLVINGEATLKAWHTFTTLAAIVVFIAAAIWNAALKLIYICGLGLVVWLIASGALHRHGVLHRSWLRGGVDYSLVLTTGLYAYVPALYLTYLINLIPLYIPFLQTLLLLAGWGLALAAILRPVHSNGADPGAEGQPLRLWRVLIGLPMLLLFAWNLVFPPWQDPLLTWVVAIITLIVLLTATWLTQEEPRIEVT